MSVENSNLQTQLSQSKEKFVVIENSSEKLVGENVNLQTRLSDSERANEVLSGENRFEAYVI